MKGDWYLGGQVRRLFNFSSPHVGGFIVIQSMDGKSSNIFTASGERAEEDALEQAFDHANKNRCLLIDEDGDTVCQMAHSGIGCGDEIQHDGCPSCNAFALPFDLD